jgi:hypothetical protein
MMTLQKNILFAVLAVSALASAQATMPADKAERCATRLSISLLGKSASTTFIANPDPQSQVDQMLASPDFIERFSRFANSQMNDDPADLPEADSAYYLTKYVLTNNRPWSDLFLGAYNVDKDVTTSTVMVKADPNGLGYFRSLPWLKRYAGNEPAGIKISTAYRMMNNTVGLKLVASTNAPGADVSATGRQAAGCRPCHYDSWFALDKTAGVLSKRVGTGATMTFSAYTGPSMPILGGIMIQNDKELMTALVQSEAFRFNTCRMAFKYLYGRAEQTCDGPVFDQCMQEFTAKGTIQSALAVVAKNSAYCQ